MGRQNDDQTSCQDETGRDCGCTISQRGGTAKFNGNISTTGQDRKYETTFACPKRELIVYYTKYGSVVSITAAAVVVEVVVVVVVVVAVVVVAVVVVVVSSSSAALDHWILRERLSLGRPDVWGKG